MADWGRGVKCRSHAGTGKPTQSQLETHCLLCLGAHLAGSRATAGPPLPRHFPSPGGTPSLPRPWQEVPDPAIPRQAGQDRPGSSCSHHTQMPVRLPGPTCHHPGEAEVPGQQQPLGDGRAHHPHSAMSASDGQQEL